MFEIVVKSTNIWGAVHFLLGMYGAYCFGNKYVGKGLTFLLGLVIPYERTFTMNNTDVTHFISVRKFRTHRAFKSELVRISDEMTRKDGGGEEFHREFLRVGAEKPTESKIEELTK